MTSVYEVTLNRWGDGARQEVFLVIADKLQDALDHAEDHLVDSGVETTSVVWRGPVAANLSKCKEGAA